MFDCSCFASYLSGLPIKILPVCISLEGITGHQFQNTGFPHSVFSLISRESFDQHITPLGDHMPIYVNFRTLEMAMPIETKRCPVESQETCRKTCFVLGRLSVEFRWLVI